MKVEGEVPASGELMVSCDPGGERLRAVALCLALHIRRCGESSPSACYLLWLYLLRLAKGLLG